MIITHEKIYSNLKKQLIKIVDKKIVDKKILDKKIIIDYNQNK
jgi:hypothetical protein